MNYYYNFQENNSSPKYPLLALIGPTAAGKTSFSLKLASKIDGEIISADSMQVYKNMDIGTAKVDPSIRKKIPHHLIDIITPDKNFSVAQYQKKADKLIQKINRKSKLPMLVGGTGLYVKAVIQGFLLPEMEKNPDLRKKLKKKSQTYGNQYLHNILAEIDPVMAEKIHPNDIRRVIRGIEIFNQTGKTKTFYKKKQQQKPPRYHYLKIGIKREREELYQRINKRVEKMIEEGLIEEVKNITEQYDLSKTALQALGYKEIKGYLNNKYSQKEAVRLIKKNTRNFAKRQLSWFRRDDDIYWFNLSCIAQKEALKKSLKLINKKLY